MKLSDLKQGMVCELRSAKLAEQLIKECEKELLIYFEVEVK